MNQRTPATKEQKKAIRIAIVILFPLLLIIPLGNKTTGTFVGNFKNTTDTLWIKPEGKYKRSVYTKNQNASPTLLLQYEGKYMDGSYTLKLDNFSMETPDLKNSRPEKLYNYTVLKAKHTFLTSEKFMIDDKKGLYYEKIDFRY